MPDDDSKQIIKVPAPEGAKDWRMTVASNPTPHVLKVAPSVMFIEMAESAMRREILQQDRPILEAVLKELESFGCTRVDRTEDFVRDHLGDRHSIDDDFTAGYLLGLYTVACLTPAVGLKPPSEV